MQILSCVPDDPLLQGNHRRPVLVLGLGNILLHDEGVGVRSIERLQQRYRLPPEVEVMDGGTAGMALYEHILDRTHLIVVDAVRTGCPPGSIVRLDQEQVPAYFQTRVSPHQMALSDILAALQIAGLPMPAITLIGIVPLTLETGIGLSAPIAARVDVLVRMTAERLQEIGCAALPPRLH